MTKLVIASKFEVDGPLTDRNFFKSLPDPISLRVENARFISILQADANFKTGFSGMFTSGIRGGDLTEKKRDTEHIIHTYTVRNITKDVAQNQNRLGLLLDESGSI